MRMTFKAFLSTQADDITDEEAASKYTEYKLEFRRQQLNEFFSNHKDSEWFQQRYHPQLSKKREEELRDRVKKRLTIFRELESVGLMDKLSVQSVNELELVKLLNTVVIKLEGGGEDDLKILDMDSDTSTATGKDRELHLTSSIFLPLLSPAVTHSELEAVSQNYPGYLRLSLSPPDQAKNWTRRAWITFQRKAKIKEVNLEISLYMINDFFTSDLLQTEQRQTPWEGFEASC